ncbi:MAG: hypothetical protein PHQ47_03445 [Candidatus Portnoybacteria bacterium]|nr:hypothetical protein [Candidatus Portnoybacteria bacterium]
MAIQNNLNEKIAGAKEFFLNSQKIILVVSALVALFYCFAIFFFYVWRTPSPNPDIKDLSLDERIYGKINSVVKQRQANLDVEKAYWDPFN